MGSLVLDYANPIKSLTKNHQYKQTLKSQRSEGRSPFVAQLTSPNHMHLNYFPEDPHFHQVMHEAERAIMNGHNPSLIPMGTSGSYFVLGEDGTNTIGVFKPKDEEPFAPLNPKWPKFFQRMCCCCLFGRSCLISNHGYLSETGASLVDTMLGLNIVPKTRVVWLRSTSFHYTKTKKKSQTDEEYLLSLSPKSGSFQVFVNGYQGAKHWLTKWDSDDEDEQLDEPAREKFVYLLQKLTVLDYIIRNTDRHADNWLLKYDKDEQTVELAAIDNGLAFPYKHPEEVSRWRTFPFGWSELKWSREPYSTTLRDELLPKLDDTRFVANLCAQLRLLFIHANHDHGFNPTFVHGQVKVLVGQVWNLREALAHGESPWELTQKPPMLATHRFAHGRRPPKHWQNAFRIKPAKDARNAECCFQRSPRSTT